MAKGFLYLVVIMDWVSRAVLAWRLSNTLGAEFCVEALEEALSLHGQPEIFNTDQGCPAETGVENRPEFSQRIDRDPRTARCDRCAHRSVAHPCRDLARQTRPDLDVKDLTPGTPLSAIDANALTVKRMPGVRHHDKLRSVC